MTLFYLISLKNPRVINPQHVFGYDASDSGEFPIKRLINGVPSANLLDRTFYTHFHNYSHTERKSPEELKTLNIVTTLLDNAAFVRIHVVERFSKDFSEVCGLRSRRFQL